MQAREFVVASPNFAQVFTHLTCVDIYLLVIAVVNLHLATIFIFSYLCPHFCEYLYQRLNV